MAWYNILFFAVLIFFVLKLVLTLFFGDTDVDFDADGDIDFDLSSLFSFKGVLHSLLGFSTYLASVAHFDNTSIGFDESYNFSIGNYILAVVIGLIFSVVLFYLYKLMMKLNHYNDQNLDVNGYKCTILISNGIVDTQDHNHAYSYTVLVNTEVGSRKINVLSNKKNLEIGSEHKILMNEQGIYFI